MTDTKMIQISLTPDQLNTIGGALAEMPFRVAAPLMQELQKQIQAAQGPTQTAAPGVPA